MPSVRVLVVKPNKCDVRPFQGIKIWNGPPQFSSLSETFQAVLPRGQIGMSTPVVMPILQIKWTQRQSFCFFSHATEGRVMSCFQVWSHNRRRLNCHQMRDLFYFLNDLKLQHNTRDGRSEEPILMQKLHSVLDLSIKHHDFFIIILMLRPKRINV